MSRDMLTCGAATRPQSVRRARTLGGGMGAPAPPQTPSTQTRTHTHTHPSGQGMVGGKPVGPTAPARVDPPCPLRTGRAEDRSARAGPPAAARTRAGAPPWPPGPASAPPPGPPASTVGRLATRRCGRSSGRPAGAQTSCAACRCAARRARSSGSRAGPRPSRPRRTETAAPRPASCGRCRPRLGRLDGRVDQALAAAHGVEEELLRREAAQVRVLDEAARFGPIVVLCEVGERAVEEAVRDALALDVLLPDARNHLRDVDEETLGAGGDHVLHVVGLLERLLGRDAGFVARLVQDLSNIVFERLDDGAPRLALELVMLRLFHQLLHLRMHRAAGPCGRLYVESKLPAAPSGTSGGRSPRRPARLRALPPAEPPVSLRLDPWDSHHRWWRAQGLGRPVFEPYARGWDSARAEGVGIRRACTTSGVCTSPSD
eukprot:scaffold4556_cov114-Isochrysis_galbana.AAC.11